MSALRSSLKLDVGMIAANTVFPAGRTIDLDPHEVVSGVQVLDSVDSDAEF